MTWPAGFEQVIAVGALDGSQPAWFTNYGTWVNACAQGTNVVSNYYSAVPNPKGPYSDLDKFPGWATWSGTSFSAPVVAAHLAQDVIASGGSPMDAVERTIGQPELFRVDGLGTVINAF